MQGPTLQSRRAAWLPCCACCGGWRGTALQAGLRMQRASTVRQCRRTDRCCLAVLASLLRWLDGYCSPGWPAHAAWVRGLPCFLTLIIRPACCSKQQSAHPAPSLQPLDGQTRQLVQLVTVTHRAKHGLETLLVL